MKKLFQRQLARATNAEGKVDFDLLAELVVSAYADADRDRERMDRSLQLMADELQVANTRLLDAFEIIPEGIVLLSNEGRYLHYNKKFLELYDTASDKIKVGSSFMDSVIVGVERGHYLDAVGHEQEWLADRLAPDFGDERVIEQHLRGDRWVSVRERRTADGGTIGVRVDITDLKRREEALSRRSEQLVEAQRLGKIGDWQWGLDKSDMWWSAQLFDLLGYSPDTFFCTRDEVASIFIDDGAHRLLEFQSDIIRTQRAGSIDVKLRRGDNSIGDFVIAAKAMQDDKGQIIGLSGTMQDISERKSAEEKLQRLAYFDPLTGLANRALFNRKVNDVLTATKRNQSSAALLLLDLDRFKEVNDSLGHASGDELLGKIAHMISRVVGVKHFLARLGGDEFAVIVTEFSSKAEIAEIAADIIQTVSGTISLERGDTAIGTSIGIAMIPGDGASLVDLQRNADLALYRAKEDGRGRFVFFEPEMSAVVQRKILLARDLRLALVENNGLSIHYQPQVDLQNNWVIGFEALMRWNHPVHGAIPPSEFIPIAESSQLICDLGLWVLRQAVRQAKHWYDTGALACKVSVNVSAAQIWNTDFARDVANTIKEMGLPPHLLCLELTESLLADHAEGRVRAVLLELKRLGVSLALDDFGTDYSSLGYLHQLPFDNLKIDRMFLAGIETPGRARKLLEGIIALGNGLGMTIMAEGAETAKEVAILRELSCHMVQGYAFARPVPASEAMSFAEAFNRKHDKKNESAEAAASLAGNSVSAQPDARIMRRSSV